MRKAPKAYEFATSERISDDGPRGPGSGLRSYLRSCGVLDRDETGKHPIASQFPILLWGPPGTGKTCAAAVVYRQWPSPVTEDRNVGAFWFRLEDWVAAVLRCRTSKERKVTMLTAGGQRVDRDENRLWQMAEADWLCVLDDIGLRNVTPAAYEIVFRLIDARQRRPTIITSNLKPILDRSDAPGTASLSALYDDRIASRLCSGRVVHVTGHDQRIQQGRSVEV